MTSYLKSVDANLGVARRWSPAVRTAPGAGRQAHCPPPGKHHFLMSAHPTVFCCGWLVT